MEDLTEAQRDNELILKANKLFAEENERLTKEIAELNETIVTIRELAHAKSEDVVNDIINLIELVEKLKVALAGVISEADRETVAFQRAKQLLAELEIDA